MIQDQSLRGFASIAPYFLKERVRYLVANLQSCYLSRGTDIEDLQFQLGHQAIEFALVGMFKESFACCHSNALLEYIRFQLESRYAVIPEDDDLGPFDHLEGHELIVEVLQVLKKAHLFAMIDILRREVQDAADAIISNQSQGFMHVAPDFRYSSREVYDTPRICTLTNYRGWEAVEDFFNTQHASPTPYAEEASPKGHNRRPDTEMGKNVKHAQLMKPAYKGTFVERRNRYPRDILSISEDVHVLFGKTASIVSMLATMVLVASLLMLGALEFDSRRRQGYAIEAAKR